jgi:hypothetical protein
MKLRDLLPSWAMWGLVIVGAVLWGLRPAHPHGALEALILVVAIAYTAVWISVVVSGMRSATRWITSGGIRGMRHIGAGLTLRSFGPLLLCIAVLGVWALFIVAIA